MVLLELGYLFQRQWQIADLRVAPTQYCSTRQNGVAYLSSEGRKIDKFMSTACWRYAANPCLCVPRLRLRLAPPAQTHDSVLTGSSAMPHRLWEPQSPLEMGLFRLLYGGGPLLGIAWIAEPPWYRLGRPPMNKTGTGSALLRAMLSLIIANSRAASWKFQHQEFN